MKFYHNPDTSIFAELSQRPALNSKSLNLLIRSIFEQVATKGDQALKEMTLKYDGVNRTSLPITLEEAEKAWGKLNNSLRVAIEKASQNIRTFHAAQVQEPIHVHIDNGIKLGQKSVPIQRVGIYIPAGTAPLISTVMMLAIPARIAGCPEIVLCSPPTTNGSIHPAILATAYYCGVTEIYAVGGAQAIAAMSVSTSTIKSVQKIFGPGNQYVTAAKSYAQNYGVAMDLPAGPSELLVYADETSIPSYVAADLLSQLEHGVDSQVILVCSSNEIGEAIQLSVQEQLKTLPRQQIAEQSWKNSLIVVLSDENRAIDFINIYAPEHLILSGTRYTNIFDKITSAGSIFLGNYCPESAGDYASGTNHTLPTSGWAQAYSGVNLDAFMKKITFQEMTKAGLTTLASTITTLARAEQLEAHARAVDIRFTPKTEL